MMKCKNGCGNDCPDPRFEFCSDECAIEHEETRPNDPQGEFINQEVATMRSEE